jgi:hypothetical protein
MNRLGGRLTALTAGLAATSALVAGALATPAVAAGKATVNVVHGIPGVPVAVCVDGAKVVDGFRYGEKVVGAKLPAGNHRVRVVAAGSGCGADAILREGYTLDAGRNYTIVANLDDSGAPNLLAVANKTRPTRPGYARLTVRHTAQAPAVNVWANGAKVIGGTSFTWGDQRALGVPADTYRTKVTLPGSKKAVIGPADLTLRAGRAYQVYAVGSPDRFRLVVLKVAVGTR